MELVQPIRDKQQLEAMKRYLRGTSLRDYCLFVLGINSGLRISDLLLLRVEDVLSPSGKVKDRVSLRERKTGKMKDFPIGNSARKALTEYFAQNPLTAHEPLFPSRKRSEGERKPLSRVQAYRILSEAAKAVGIRESIGTHTLRKTFGYHAYTMGTDITRLQKLLNHSAPSITLAYIGITQEELDQVYIALNL